MRPHRIVLLALLFLAGCFSIELDVNSEGQLLVARQEGFFLVDPATQQVKRLQEARAGTEPVFARFAPNGKQILTVAKSGFNTFQFTLVDLDGGKQKEVLTVDQAANVRFSPDGKSLLVVAASKEDDKEFESKVPELHLVNLATGQSKIIAKRIGVHVRWLPDSKQALVVNVRSKVDDSSFAGNVSLLDVATGKLTPKAAVIGKQDFACDLSPDGTTAILSAIKMGKAGSKLDKGDAWSAPLHRINLATGAVDNLEFEAKFAYFSPAGNKLLLALEPEGFSFNTVSLQVADAGDVANRTPLVEAAFPMALGGEGTVLAGWINDDKIYYFSERKVYGVSGKSLHLMTITSDGQEKKLLQPLIDAAAFE